MMRGQPLPQYFFLELPLVRGCLPYLIHANIRGRIRAYWKSGAGDEWSSAEGTRVEVPRWWGVGRAVPPQKIF